ALANWTPDRVERMSAPEKNNGRGGERTLMLWIVPADVAGRWQGTIGDGDEQRPLALSLAQQLQYLEAQWRSARHAPVTLRASLVGAARVLEAPPSAPAGAGRITARVEGHTLVGTWTPAQAGAATAAVRAHRVSSRPDLSDARP